MEQFGIGLLSQVPLRETISHASEMVSQLLFGETFTVLEKYTHWFRIRTDADGYEAWVDSKQIQLVSKEQHQLWLADTQAAFTLAPYNRIQRTGDLSQFPVGMGCRLPVLENGVFQTAETGFNAQDALMTAEKRQALTETERREALLKSAVQWLNTPYLWGGKSIFGTDCSGFTQTLYRIYGFQLQRDAKDQAGAGEAVNFLDEAKPADLLFFDNENEQIVHVGIYMGNSRIIHASGMVRIDTIDHQGIYRQDTKNYSHKLRLIRRMF
ncbi:MAG: C40 family peptidase [Bacteroidales bacterium]|nr:C40 family peptidase [Bacteroidales bacterium]